MPKNQPGGWANATKNNENFGFNRTLYNTRISYRVFHGFGQAKFAYGASILGSSQFSLLPQFPKKRCLVKKWSKLTQK